jgi:hypothetical protein
LKRWHHEEVKGDRKGVTTEEAQRNNRAKEDDVLAPEVECLWQSNMQAYGVEKAWRPLNRAH